MANAERLGAPCTPWRCSTLSAFASALTALRTVALPASASAPVGLGAVPIPITLSAVCLLPVAPCLSLSAPTTTSVVTVAAACSPKLDHLGEAFADDGPLIVIGHAERLPQTFGLSLNLFAIDVLGACGKTKTERCHDDGHEKEFLDGFHILGFFRFD